MLTRILRIVLSLLLACALPASHAAVDDTSADDTVAPLMRPSLDVKVERVASEDGGKMYRIASSGTVAATPSAVWRILTDYNHMADYVPDMKSARVVARNGDRVTLEQRGVARLLFFSRDIHLVVQVHEVAPSKIEVSLIDGDMKVYRCSWEIIPVAETGGTRVRYNATIEPKFYVPGLVGTSLVRKDIGKMMAAVLARLDRPE